MDIARHFQSLSDECIALKDRVRHLIAGRHWATDGEWKESVVRTMLRRHLPAPFEVGRGFVVSLTNVSTQIDVLVYDGSHPVLFKEGDLVFVGQRALKAIIEVKSSVGPRSAANAIIKLSNEAAKFGLPAREEKIFALFAFNWVGRSTTLIEETLQASAQGNVNRVVDLLALGPDKFVKWWYSGPTRTGSRRKWQHYDLPNAAFGYFLHNVIVELCKTRIGDDAELWFPMEGKELGLVREIPLGTSMSPQESLRTS